MLSFNQTLLAIVVAVHPSPSGSASPANLAGQVDGLLVFGAAAVFLMLFCRLNQVYAPSLVFGTATFGLMSAAYGFLVGAWPLGVAVLAYSLVVLRPVFKARRPALKKLRRFVDSHAAEEWQEESRVSRMFGPS